MSEAQNVVDLVRSMRLARPVPRDAIDPRERDARCAWVALPARLKVELCERAEVPDAADRMFSELTKDERHAIAVAASRFDALGGFMWGLMQA